MNVRLDTNTFANILATARYWRDLIGLMDLLLKNKDEIRLEGWSRRRNFFPFAVGGYT